MSHLSVTQSLRRGRTALAGAAISVVAGVTGLVQPGTAQAATESLSCVGPTCAGRLPAPDTSKGTKYYISTSGSTANSGTSPSSPWPFSKASGAFAAGDSVNFACGQSFGRLYIGASGVAGDPVIYQTDPSCSVRATFGGITVGARSHVTINNIRSTFGSGTNFSAIGSGSTRVTLQNSEIVGQTGVASLPMNVGASYFTLDSTVVHDSGDSGMIVYGSNALIQYNRFYGTGGALSYGTHNIYLKSDYSTLRFNDFSRNSNGQLVSVRRNTVSIYGNAFHDSGYALGYFGEGYTGGKISIYNNRFWNISGWITYAGANTAPANANFSYVNNTIQGGSSSASAIHLQDNAGTGTFYNNAVLGYGKLLLTTTRATQANNLINPAGLGAAPGFVPTSGSAVVDRGTLNAGLTFAASCDDTARSYCGSAPDVGAREYGAGTGTIAPVADTTAPSVPGSLAGTVAGTTASLTWAPASDNVGVTGYKVFVDGALAKTVTGTSTTIALAVGRTYRVAVAAVDAAGNTSAQSAAVSVIAPDVVAPSVPATLVGAVSGTTASLSWGAATDNVGVTAYRVFVGGALAQTVTGTSTAIELVAGQTAVVTVAAVDAAGNASAQSNAVSVTAPIIDTLTPTVPGTPTATAGSTSVTLSWAPARDNVAVTAYQVLMSGHVVRTVTGTSVTVSPLAAGTYYLFSVAAVDAAGNVSPRTPAVGVTTRTNTTADTTAPSVPVATGGSTLVRTGPVTVSASGSTDGGSGVAGYEYSYSKDGGRTWTRPASGSSLKVTWTGTTYVEFRAIDKAGNASAYTRDQVVNLSSVSLQATGRRATRLAPVRIAVVRATRTSLVVRVVGVAPRVARLIVDGRVRRVSSTGVSRVIRLAPRARHTVLLDVRAGGRWHGLLATTVRSR